MIAEVQRWPGAESLGDAKVRPAAGWSMVELGSVQDSSWHGSMPYCTSFLSCPQECLDFASAAWCRLFCRLHGGELLLEALLLHSEALEQGQRQAEPAALAALQALHSLVRCVARLLDHLSVGHETTFSFHPSCSLCSHCPALSSCRGFEKAANALSYSFTVQWRGGHGVMPGPATIHPGSLPGTR